MVTTRDFFEAIEHEFEEMDKRFDRVMSDLKTKDWNKVPRDKVAFYGWTFNVGPDGVPHWHEFGNVRPGDPALPAATREPLVSRMRDKARGETHFTIEVPGVDKKDVAIDATRDIIRVHAGAGDRMFGTNIETGEPIDTASVKATYRNGVLDVTAKHDARGKSQKRSVPIG